jgi:hypothetical protein
MLNSTMIGLCAGFAALLASALPALAQDAIAAPAQKTTGQPAKSDMIPSLAVINSRGATLQGNRGIECDRLRRSPVQSGRARADQTLPQGMG